MNVIVCADQNWGIGRGGELLVRISADLKRFKALTLGHPVILGRKTLATFPGGRPLPGRRNLVLSRDRSFRPGGVEVFRDLDSLVAEAPVDSFVIGGGEVYRQLLPWCRTAYVTRLAQAYPADAWFPDLDGDPAWQIIETEGPFPYEGGLFRYVTYHRRQ